MMENLQKKGLLQKQLADVYYLKIIDSYLSIENKRRKKS